MSCQEILVVDDDSGIRETLKDLLELEGYHVSTAANGQEGLQRLSQITPCLVLLDLMMPVMNGWEVLKNLRARQDALLAQHRVAVISAAAAHAQDLEAYGCEILSKPVNIERLLRLVRSCCTPQS